MILTDNDVVQMTLKEYKELLFYKAYYEAHTIYDKDYYEKTYDQFVKECQRKEEENYPSLHGAPPAQKEYK